MLIRSHEPALLHPKRGIRAKHDLRLAVPALTITAKREKH